MLQALEESFIVKAVTEVPVTLAIVGGLVVTGGLQAAVGGMVDMEQLVALGSVSRDYLGPLDGWRLLTSSWLHWDTGHWVGNVALLLPMGLLVESAVGSRRFAAVFAAATVLGSAASLVVYLPQAGMGISDGVFGLLGMAMAMAVAPAGRLSSAQSGALRRYVVPLTWLAILQSLSPHVSLAAHGVGLLVGLVAVGSGLVWLGVPRRYEGQVHSWEPGAMMRWTLAAMTCGLADLALFVISVGLCLVVWLDLAHDAEPPSNLAGPSTVVGAVGAATLGVGWAGVVWLAWGMLPDAEAPPDPADQVVVHPDLPPLRDRGPDPTLAVLERPEDPDEVVLLLLDGVERPGLVQESPCPTVWWKDCVRRLFPDLVVQSCDRGNADEIRTWSCEENELPPLQLGLLSDGVGNRIQARNRYEEAEEGVRVDLLKAQGCTAILRALKGVESSDDPWAWRDGARVAASCDRERADRLQERFDAWSADRN